MPKKSFNTDRLFTTPEATKTAPEATLTSAEEKVVFAINELAKKHITTFTPGTLNNFVNDITGDNMTADELAEALEGLKNNPRYDDLTRRVNETPKGTDPRINLRLTAENMDFIQSEKWHRRQSATVFINQIIEEYRINHEV